MHLLVFFYTCIFLERTKETLLRRREEKVLRIRMRRSIRSKDHFSEAKNISNKSIRWVGNLHTELRALKRKEYDQERKEREKLASLIRREREKETMRKQLEEIQTIRMQTLFRSKPVKHYNQVLVNKSSKPVTVAKSPNFIINKRNKAK